MTLRYRVRQKIREIEDRTRRYKRRRLPSERAGLAFVRSCARAFGWPSSSADLAPYYELGSTRRERALALAHAASLGLELPIVADR